MASEGETTVEQMAREVVCIVFNEIRKSAYLSPDDIDSIERCTGNVQCRLTTELTTGSGIVVEGDSTVRGTGVEPPTGVFRTTPSNDPDMALLACDVPYRTQSSIRGICGHVYHRLASLCVEDDLRVKVHEITFNVLRDLQINE